MTGIIYKNKSSRGGVLKKKIFSKKNKKKLAKLIR